MIFNIQRYSTHDGPGIRSVIFFKGCSLSCRWCQNPESESRNYELLFDDRLCLQDCRLCTNNFPHIFYKENNNLRINRDIISNEEYIALKNFCPSTALSLCGEEKSPDQIMREIHKDRAFYLRSGGGVTLSGGEPFMQPELALELLRRCREVGYHTAVETCLHTSWKQISPALPYLNLILADLKHTEADIFRQWTGGSLKRILDNYRRLSAESEADIIVRIPLIPQFNADKATITTMVDFVAHETKAKEIHFLPYHKLGMNKYKLLNIAYLAPQTPLEDIELLAFAQQYAQQQHLTPILGG
ncbi:pyruvate formate lyase activating enzyme [Mesocricetibacter intestinalis]|uniref:Pyruvate formate lyase activating enzyme n=1 Tax=Mesocricetibacter intestinalis TaxID=1521930 RepID=A0A4R6VAA2_9PAST|nr:glycyl-radical enzyme activating protein [Mesocricetibacter intestinalis]TDQ56638.1 pyruvate formate lyase activating enzyme [Mesocricetibacter intestinalis]